LQEAFPQLARIGQEHGTQVIFAPQHAVGRQASVDIADFTRVLSFYLRLDSAPELSERLTQIIEERTGEARRMASEIEALESRYRKRLEQVQAQVNVILTNAPWGEGPAPSGTETEDKINLFVAEQARLYEHVGPDVSGKSALATVKDWIDNAVRQTTEALQRREAQLTSQLSAARERWRQVVRLASEVEAVRTQLTEDKDQLAAALGTDRPIENLEKILSSAEQRMTETQARADMARRAETLCRSVEAAQCPLCGTSVGWRALEKAIRDHIAAAVDLVAEMQAIEALRTRVESARRLSASILKQEEELKTLDTGARQAYEALCEALAVETSQGVPTSELNERIDVLANDVEGLKREIANAKVEQERKLKILRSLELELAYHNYRDAIAQLQESLTAGLEPLRTVLAAHTELIETGQRIQSVLDEAYNDALDRAAPHLNAMMTDVYARLTRQLSYEKVCITRDTENPRRRELRVASAKLPGRTFPPNVLNGQAAKALQLVPYFVFSRFQPEVLELDLLLIDDPSESFDTSHVESLVTELANAANHAQLVVATHEREKFDSRIRQSFEARPYSIVAVSEFDPLRGPRLTYG